MTTAQYAVPIPQRAQPGYDWLWNALLFGVFFDGAMIMINATQFLLFPLRLLALYYPQVLLVYDWGIQYTKGAFGTLLVLITQWFAPTKFIITMDGTNEVFDVIPRDDSFDLKLPDKMVIMGNHQVYTDWMYLWCLLYYAKAHDQVLIILKNSLKHIPIVGWGMQFFRFIFLARSWAKDRGPLGEHVINVAERAKAADNKLALMIFPEGTLVSRDTRPLSKKFADKTGIADCTNVLLPRSTGLLFILRSMAPSIPNLQLLDVTVGYPGIPPAGYGQDYYTLRSIFFQGIAPPAIHIHMRLTPVSDIPIGAVSAKDGVERGAEASSEEIAAFESWLLERWREKDALMGAFYQDGRFPAPGVAEKAQSRHVEIPIRLRSTWEVANAVCFMAPAAAYYGFKWVRTRLFG